MGKHLVVVADSSNARIMEQDGSKLKVLGPIYARDRAIDDFDIGAAKPGRIKVPTGSHTFSPRSDIHKTEKEHFIREVAKHLNNGFSSMESLVLIAPPETLGELRKLLSHNVIAKVAHEIRKDLTKLREDELTKYVSKPYV